MVPALLSDRRGAVVQARPYARRRGCSVLIRPGIRWEAQDRCSETAQPAFRMDGGGDR